ncbi:MAG: hypothetical protein AB1540_12455 [Bdellovibrionota bacterium]
MVNRARILLIWAVTTSMFSLPVQAAKPAQATSLALPEKSETESQRILNLQISPLGFAMRRYNFSALVATTKNVAIGPKFTVIDRAPSVFFESERGYELGIRADLYVAGERFKDGFLLRPGVFYGFWRSEERVGRTLDDGFQFNRASNTTTMREEVANGLVVELMAAYQFFLFDRLNLEAGIGIKAFEKRYREVSLIDGSVRDYRAPQVAPEPVVELNLGFII